MSKRVKNEQWFIKNFMSDLHNDKIIKPRFQRKKNGVCFHLKIARQMRKNI